MTLTFHVIPDIYIDFDLHATIQGSILDFALSQGWEVDLDLFYQQLSSIPFAQLFRGPYTIDDPFSGPLTLTLMLGPPIDSDYFDTIQSCLQSRVGADMAYEIMVRLVHLCADRRFPYSDRVLIHGVMKYLILHQCMVPGCERPYYYRNMSEYTLVRNSETEISALDLNSWWYCLRTGNLVPNVGSEANVIARHAVKDRLLYLNLPFPLPSQGKLRICTPCTYHVIGKYTIANLTP